MRSFIKSGDILSRVFSVFVVFMPILQYYKSLVSAFNAGTFLALVFLVAFSVDSIRRKKVKIRITPVVVAYIMLLVINYYLQMAYREASYIDGLKMNYNRAMMLMITIIILGHYYFDEHFAFEVLGILLSASAFLMMIQIVGRSIGFQFTGTIPVLLKEPSYGIPTSRVSGFYMEPSHYAQSALLYLCWALFDEIERRKKQLIEIAIVMVGVILSTSGQGYILLAVVVLIWYCRKFVFSNKLSEQGLYRGIFVLVAIMVVLALVANTSIFKLAIERISSDRGIFGSQAFLGRTWSEYLLRKLSNRNRWIGMGLGAMEDVYLTGYNSYLYSFGYLSYLFFVVLIWQILFSKKKYALPFAIVFAIEIYISSVVSPYYICFFMSFVLGKNRKETSISSFK